MAKLVATRGTCLRRMVGCVLTDERNRILATGYNGVPSGEPHCNELVIERMDVAVGHGQSRFEGMHTHPNACEGAFAKAGTDLHRCRALHAEENALISCRDPQDIRTAYCTVSPCERCVDRLLNTSCSRIVFESPYPHAQSEIIWVRAGRMWVHYVGEGS